MKKIVFILSILSIAGCQTVTQSPTSAVVVKKPTEPMMCTMQYDPVCGKVTNSTGTFSYKTYSNACVANNSGDNVVSITQGACGADK